MMSQLDVNLMVLLVLLACGIFSHNTAVTIAAGILIVFKMTPLEQFSLSSATWFKYWYYYFNYWCAYADR